jgi:uncharacterized protein (DUF1501 family)
MPSNRRLFLKQLGTAGIVSLGIAPPTFLSRAAHSFDTSPDARSNGRVLVLVQLAGGNDGLNTVVPHGDAEYYKARPGLGIPRATLL